MGRLGKKIANGLRMGAKVGAGVLGTAGVVVGGLYALGSKAEQQQTNVMGGQSSIKNVSTSDLDKLYSSAPTQEQKLAKELAFQKSIAGLGPEQMMMAIEAHKRG